MDVTESRRAEPGCQRFLVYALFVWVTILSFAVAITLTLILTAPPQNVPFEYVPSQEIITELNTKVRKTVLSWTPGEVVTGKELLSVQGDRLLVNGEGIYFLYVQVTLLSGDTPTVAPVVRVQQGDKTLLESVLTRKHTDGPFTTGFLGRRVMLSFGKHITVSCSKASFINTAETATYLGVYLLKHL